MYCHIRRMIVAAFLCLFVTGFLSPVFSEEKPKAKPSAPKKRTMLFNFKETPFEQVLDLFSRASGLPIVRGNVKLEGNLTYFSARQYTILEALEVLNTILVSKGAYLLRDRNQLRLVPMSDVPQQPTIPVYSGGLPDKTKPAPDRVVTVILPLKYVSAADAGAQLKVLISRFAKMVVVGKSNRLVLTDTAANVRRIQQVLRDIDVATLPAESQLRVFPLRHAEARQARATLHELMVGQIVVHMPIGQKGETQRVRRPRHEDVSFGLDERTNSIVAVAPAAKMTMIAEAIQLIDVPGSPDRRDVKTFILSKVKAADAAAALQKHFAQAFKPRRKGKLPLMSVSVMGGRNRLLVSTTPSYMLLADQLIRQLEGGLARTEPIQVKVVPLKVARAAEVVATLTKLYTGGVAPAEMNIAVDAKANSVILRGPADQVSAAAEVIASIDARTPAARQVQVLSLRYAKAEEVVDKAKKMLARTGLPKEKVESLHVEIDPSKQKLLVSADPVVVNRFAGFVHQLDELAGRKPPLKKTLSFKKAKAVKVSSRLVQLVRQLGEVPGRPARAVRVVPMEKTNQIIVFADAETMKLVEEVAAYLDTEGPLAQREIKMILVEGANVRELAGTLDRLYRARLEADGRDTKLVRIEAEPASSHIIVWAPPEDMQAIEKLLEQVHKQVQIAPREVRVFSLQHAKAHELVPILNKMFPQPMKTYYRRGRIIKVPAGPAEIQFSANPANNSLIVEATKERWPSLEKAIKMLDVPQPTVDMEIRTYQLTRKISGSVLNTLRSVHNGGGLVEPRYRHNVRFDLEPISQLLLVTAPKPAFVRIEKIINEVIEKAGQQEVVTQTVTLKTPKADEIVKRAKLWLKTIGRPLPKINSIKVDVDPDKKRFLVSGEPDILKEFVRVVTRIDEIESRAKEVKKKFTLKIARAKDAASRLSQLVHQVGRRPDGTVPQLRLVPLDKTNELIVYTDPEAMHVVEEMIAYLDQPGKFAGREFRMIRIEGADVRELASTLNRLYQGQLKAEGRDPESVRIEPEPASNYLIVWAAGEDMKHIEALLKKIHQQIQVAPREVRVFSLDHARARELVPVLNKMFPQPMKTYYRRGRVIKVPSGPPEIQFSANASNNSLIVEATKERWPSLEKAIKQLDTPRTRMEMVTRTFVLKHVNAREQHETISRLIRQIARRDDGKPVQLEVAPIQRTNSLVVTADDQTIHTAEAVVKSIDLPPKAARKGVWMIRVKAANVAMLAQTINEIYQQQMKEQGRSSAEVVIRAEPSSSQLIIFASEQDYQRLAKLVEQVNKAPMLSKREFRAFPLKHARAGVLAQMLTRMFQPVPKTYLRRGRIVRVPGVPEVRFSANEQNNSLIVEAPSERMVSIEQAVKTLDKPKVSLPVEVQTFPLGEITDDKAAALLETLRKVASSGGIVSAEKTAAVQFHYEPISKLLIVTAPPEGFAKIADLIKKVQGRDIAGRPEFRVFTLQVARARIIAPMLQQILTKQFSAAARAIQVTADPYTNTLLISGPSAALKVADALIKGLDRKGGKSGAPGARAAPAFGPAVKIITLNRGNARQVGNTVRQMVQSLLKRKAPQPVEPVEIMVEPASNSLILSGQGADVAYVETLVAKLDKSSAKTELEIRTYVLKEADAASLALTLRRMFTARFRRWGRRATTCRVSADPQTQTLVVAAGKADFTLIERLIRELDVKREVRRTNLRFIALRKARAREVAATLRRMLPPPPPGGRPAVIEADTAANALLISAAPEQLAQIEPLIKKLEAVSRDQTVDVKIIPVRGAKAMKIAKLLQRLYAEVSDEEIEVRTTAEKARDKKAKRSKHIHVTVAVDEASNSLILSAPREELDKVESLINELIRDAARLGADYRLLRLKHADAEELAATIKLMLAGQMRGKVPFRVIPDMRTNSLIVRADRADFDLATKLVADLDRPDEIKFRKLQMQVFALDNVDAREVARNLRELLAQQTRSHRQSNRQFQQIRRQYRRLTSDKSLQAQLAQASVTANRATNTIIVAAPNRAMKLLARMVEVIDQAPARIKTEVKTYALKSARADDVREMLGRLFARKRAVPGAAPRPRAPTIVADSRTNSLFVSAAGKDFKLIEKLLIQLDAPKARQDVAFEVFLLEHAEAIELADTIGSLMSAQPQKPGEAPPGISADEKRNALVCFATAGQMKKIQSLIKRLDHPTRRDKRTVKFVKLKHVKAKQVWATLAEFYGRFAYAPISPEDRQVVITPDDASNSLLVQAGKEKTAEIEAFIARLDTPEAAEDRQLEIITLRHADARTVAAALREAFKPARQPRIRWPQRYRERRPLVMSMPQRPLHERVNVAAEPNTNSLVVVASPRTLKRIKEMVRQLEQMRPQRQQKIQIIAVENAPPEEIRRAIEKLFGPKGLIGGKKAGGGAIFRLLGPVSMQAMPGQRGLIVAGGAKDLETIARLVKLLDRDRELGEFTDLRLFRLANADVREIARMLLSIFGKAQAARPKGLKQYLSRLRYVKDGKTIVPSRLMLSGAAFAVTVEPDSNSLLVAASSDVMKIVADLVRTLDIQQPSAAAAIRFIPLKHAAPDRVAAVLRNIIAGRAKMGKLKKEDQAVISVDPRTESLIIATSPRTFALVEHLIRQLDVAAVSPQFEIQILALKHADATRLRQTLEHLFTRRARAMSVPGQKTDPQQQVVIAADAVSNSLLVVANKENLSVLKHLLGRLDAAPDGLAGQVQIFPVQHATASKLARTLQQLFERKRQGERAAGDKALKMPVSIIADDRSNSLLVTASKHGFEQVKDLLKQLDTKDVLDVSEFAVYPLKQASATEIAPMVENLFRARPHRGPGPKTSVQVYPDRRSNSLIVSAPREELTFIAGLIKRLDQPSEIVRRTKIFPLSKASAARIAPKLRRLFADRAKRGVQLGITHDERTNAVIVQAAPRDMQEIADLIHRLDQAKVTASSEIRIFPLRFAQANDISRTLRIVLMQQRLSAKSGRAQATLIKFVTLTPDARKQITSAVQEDIHITPDARTQSLIVSAPSNCMELMKQMIAALDKPKPKLKVKMFTLKYADATRTAQLIKNLFLQKQRRGQTVAEPGLRLKLTAEEEKSPGTRETQPAPDESRGNAMLPTGAGGPVQREEFAIVVERRTNSLLVTGSAAMIDVIGEVIERLDSSPVEERVSMVYRVKNAKAKAIERAIKTFLTQQQQQLLSTLGREAMQAGIRTLEREVAVVAEPDSNTLLISASPRFFKVLKKMVVELDQSPPQVLIQVLLAEVSLDDSLDLGVEWDVFLGKRRADGTRRFATGTELGIATDVATSMGGFSVSITSSDFLFLLRALQSQGRLEVLSRPQIMTADNQKAEISIGENVPFVRNVRITSDGSTFTNVEYEKVGIILKVTPQINPEGYVTLSVHPEISQLTKSTVKISENLTAPVFTDRSADTTVCIKDGQTIVIGGLITTMEEARESKVPLLGDIPWVGALFRNTSTLKKKTELLIVLTPHVIRNMSDAQRLSDVEKSRLDILPASLKKAPEGELLVPPLPVIKGRGPLRREIDTTMPEFKPLEPDKKNAEMPKR